MKTAQRTGAAETAEKIRAFIKKEPMPVISVMAAVISLFITPPSAKLFAGIEWHTLATFVPTSIVLFPYAENLGGLIYGVNTAGLCSMIGSLASLINYRIYVREYPGKGGKFLKTFTLICLAFFALVAVPGYFFSLGGI